MAIIGTGAAAGVGLALQITLSLFNMFGAKGKLVVLLLFLAGGAGAALLYKNKLEPGMNDTKAKLIVKKNGDPKAGDNGKNGNGGGVSSKQSRVERTLLLPKGADVLQGKWAARNVDKNMEPGSMARAFFDKDSAEYAEAFKNKDLAAQARLNPERHGELDALLAWTKLVDPERKKTYETDTFPLPSDWGKKPITADYLSKDGKVLIKSLITDRCVRCHADDENVTFSDYDTLLKYLQP
jgi:hypothetical protein